MNISNITETKYGVEGKASFILFNKDVNVMIDDTVDIDYAKKCVEHINSFTNDFVDDFCEVALKYCFGFSDDVGEEIPDIKEKKDVLNYIYPLTIIINEPEDYTKIGIMLSVIVPGKLNMV